MKSAKLSAIIYAVVLSLLLLIPTLMIRYIDHDARKVWENRTLAEFPDKSRVLKEPKAVFSEFDDYLNDHIGGSFQAIKFRRKFYFDVFNATGDLYVVGNRNGDLFLTAPFQQSDRNNPFQWWRSLCVTGQNERYQEAYAKKFERTEQFLSQRGATVVFGMVPTKPVLIQDQFPNSTPDNIRKACAEISETNNLKTAIESYSPELNIFYPYESFKSRVSDPLFYPNNAYHWQGESSWIFAEELAATYNFDVPDKWDPGPCKPANVKWDIGGLIGVGQETAGCDRNESQLGLIIDEDFSFPLSLGASKDSVNVVKMTNPHNLSNETAIIFSNSFGPIVREKIASHFKTTYHLRAGTISNPDMRALLDQSDMLNVDYIFVTVADFHYPRFLAFIGPSPEILAEEARIEKAEAVAERERMEEIKRKKIEEAVAKKERAKEKKAEAAEKRRLAQEKKDAAHKKRLAQDNEGDE